VVLVVESGVAKTGAGQGRVTTVVSFGAGVEWTSTQPARPSATIGRIRSKEARMDGVPRVVSGAIDRGADGANFLPVRGTGRSASWPVLAGDHEQVRNGFRVVEDDGTLEERGVRGWIEGPWHARVAARLQAVNVQQRNIHRICGRRPDKMPPYVVATNRRRSGCCFPDDAREANVLDAVQMTGRHQVAWTAHGMRC